MWQQFKIKNMAGERRSGSEELHKIVELELQSIPGVIMMIVQ
jgi:hypothetical protein